MAEHQESEKTLALQVIRELREPDLLMAHRYDGNRKWVARLLAQPQAPHFLLRVAERLKANRRQRLCAGSCLVHVRNPFTGGELHLREIRGAVRRPEQAWVTVRFWTNVLDPQQCPASELLARYGWRGEQEITFREIKEYLQDAKLLRSDILVTAIQDSYSLFMAQATVTSVRARTAVSHELPILHVSFARTLNACRQFGWLVATARHRRSPTPLHRLACALGDQLATQLTKPRRHRSCPRQVRQPIKKWHRLLKNSYTVGKCTDRLRSA